MVLKKFKNNLLLFPKPLLQEINAFIEKGYGYGYVRKMMVERYKGDLKIPSKPTIAKYIKWYKENNNINPKSLVKQLNDDISGTKTEIVESEKLTADSRKGILEGLINRCNNRLSRLEKLDLAVTSASLESCVISYVAEIRKIVETLLKLSGELKDDDKVVINIVETEIGKFFKVVAEAVKEVYGDEKLLIFKETLKRRLKDG